MTSHPYPGMIRLQSGRFLLVAAVAILVQSAHAQEQEAPTQLTVGTRNVPPFAMQTPDGEWEGITIDLWREIATATGNTSEFRDMELDAMLSGLQNGRIDVAAAAITVTAEREQLLDFTHAYYTSGLGIAVVPERGGLLFGLLSRLFSLEFLQALIALSIVLLGAGGLIWLFERKKNAEQFGGSSAQGLGAGFWWAAVTMTTVGYGDKAPQTPAGRFIGLVWMFTSIIIISGFTAAIATSLTIGELNASITGPGDLPGKTVGTVAGSTGEQYLSTRDIRSRDYDTVEASLAALAGGEIEAVVYDAPIMQYLVNSGAYDNIRTLDVLFERQEYAIALPEGSPLREDINRVILERTEQDWWTSVIDRYLGQ